MPRKPTIATHIILTGYGYWLPNDPRGSMSSGVFTPEIAELGERHFGRRGVQPSREQLRAFYREAEKRLAHRVLWFGDAARQAVGDAIGKVVTREGLTCYACAVLRNHAHMLIRRHRLKAQEVSVLLKEVSTEALRSRKLAPPDHPVFSADRCHIYKTTPEAVRACVQYVQDNYRKHGLPPVVHPFVKSYDNWPFHKTAGPS